MDKILNTTSQETLYSSMSERLNIDKPYIQHYIMKNMFRINRLSDANEIDIYDFFDTLSNISNIDYRDFNNISFDAITVAHLTTRINTDNIKQQSLYNLFDALVKKTDLSELLKENKFEFYMNTEGLQTRYKGQIINWKDYFNGYNSSSAKMVNRRFFGSKNVSTDKCVNGFLFNGNIHNNRDVSHIYYSPEILQSICAVLKRRDIERYWEKNANRYVVIFKTDIQNAVFDNKSRLTIKQKTFRIYRYIIYYLSKMSLYVWNENHNPIIRLKDNLNVPVSDIIDVIKIKEN